MGNKAFWAFALSGASQRLGLFLKSVAMNSVLLSSLLILSAHSSAEISHTSGDAEAGKNKSQTCTACHGTDGNSAVSTFPKIAGQNARYAFKQLKDTKAGLRPVPEMAGIVAGLSEQDMADLAAYYAEQDASLGAVDPELKELGEVIYRGGIAERSVPACIACHGPKADGMPAAGFPALSGQHAGYTASQLAAFRASARGDKDVKYRVNDGSSMIMRAAVRQMTDAEIEAVSSYISGLH